MSTSREAYQTNPVLFLCFGISAFAVFGRVDGGDEDAFDCQTIVEHGGCHRVIQLFGLLQNVQPILGFCRLFQSDMKLCNEIRFAISVLGFVDICADGSTAAQYLF